jgi:hypothetical protein
VIHDDEEIKELQWKRASFNPEAATKRRDTQRWAPGIAWALAPEISPFGQFSLGSRIDVFQTGFNAMITAPAKISAPPSHWCQVSFSPRKAAARAMAKTTLSLSTGATCDASPSCKARK